MDAGLKAKWIAALRSGEFKQGVGAYQTGNEYCCLGVLCVVGGMPISALDRDDYNFVDSAVGHDRAVQLASMNDSGATFSQIADWLEESA